MEEPSLNLALWEGKRGFRDAGGRGNRKTSLRGGRKGGREREVI